MCPLTIACVLLPQQAIASSVLGVRWQYSYLLPLIINKLGLLLLKNATLDDATV